MTEDAGNFVDGDLVDLGRHLGLDMDIQVPVGTRVYGLLPEDRGRPTRSCYYIGSVPNRRAVKRCRVCSCSDHCACVKRYNEIDEWDRCMWISPSCNLCSFCAAELRAAGELAADVQIPWEMVAVDPIGPAVFFEIGYESAVVVESAAVGPEEVR